MAAGGEAFLKREDQSREKICVPCTSLWYRVQSKRTSKVETKSYADSRREVHSNSKWSFVTSRFGKNRQRSSNEYHFDYAKLYELSI